MKKKARLPQKPAFLSGTTLRGHIEFKLQGAGSITRHRQADHDRFVINLNLAKIIVILFFAFGYLSHAQASRFTFKRKLELVAVQVIAFGDVVADFYRLPIQRTRRGLERNHGIEKILGMRRRNQQSEKKKQTAHHDWTVSAATQFK